MNQITKVSDITTSDLAEYIRLDEVNASDTNTLSNLLSVAIDYICNYTGMTRAEVDEAVDLIIVVFILVQDMWDNRVMYVNNNNLNKTVETILNLHSVNLLPKVVEENG